METILRNVLLAIFDCSPSAKHHFDKNSVLAELSPGSNFIKRVEEGTAVGEYDQSIVHKEFESLPYNDDKNRIMTIDASLVSHRVYNVHFRNVRTEDGAFDVIYVYGDVMPCGPKAKAISVFEKGRMFGYRVLMVENFNRDEDKFTRYLKTLITIDHCPNGVV